MHIEVRSDVGMYPSVGSNSVDIPDEYKPIRLLLVILAKTKISLNTFIHILYVDFFEFSF